MFIIFVLNEEASISSVESLPGLRIDITKMPVDTLKLLLSFRDGGSTYYLLTVKTLNILCGSSWQRVQ